MPICNDCKTHCLPGFVRGVSDYAGGEYYNGPEICERCIARRREDAIAEHEASAEENDNG